ncbi:MAG: cyclic nucleotide-binding domain-containing protein [Spirochaetes bacterium]|nr:cyclic nucleotide-binding domain-containing protein [Spirochaetota bacterium]
MRQLPVREVVFIDELKNTLIFQTLSVEELRKLAQVCEHFEYLAGETIVTQDSISRYLYVLLDGKVDITVRGSEKQSVRVSTIQAGDVFGEASIFMDVKRTANAVAAVDLRLVAISREHLFEMCGENTRAGLKIFTFIIYSLLRKLAAASKDLAMELESMVTQEDLDKLKGMFPKTIEDILRKH